MFKVEFLEEVTAAQQKEVETGFQTPTCISIKKSRSYATLFRVLALSPAGGNYTSLLALKTCPVQSFWGKYQVKCKEKGLFFQGEHEWKDNASSSPHLLASSSRSCTQSLLIIQLKYRCKLVQH